MPIFKRSAQHVAGMSLLFVSGAGAMLWLMPGSLRPLDYMVAGSFATALGRVAAFWLIARPSR